MAETFSLIYKNVLWYYFAYYSLPKNPVDEKHEESIQESATTNKNKFNGKISSIHLIWLCL